ncbi:MAG: hypothetical protein U0169_01105 [Polyangiaceae bacterium]
MRSLKFLRTRTAAVLLVLGSTFAVGCASEAPVDEASNVQSAGTTAEGLSQALRTILKDLRGADIKTTGGFGRSLASHLDDVVRGAGEDVSAQRRALKEIFGVELPKDILPTEFTSSMKQAFQHQYRPLAEGAANAAGAADNLAHVDSIVADIIEGFPDIVKNLESSGVEGSRAMDLLLAVAWHDTGKMMDPAYIASVPQVKVLLESDAFAAAIAKVPEQFRENYKNKFILQVLCHEFGSIKALEDSKDLKESVIKRIASFIEDHNDGSGNPAAWWNTQWKTIFNVEYSPPKTAVGFVLAALDRARQGSLEMLTTAEGVRKLDGGIIKIANNTKAQGKTLGFVVQDSIVVNNARSLEQLRTMTQTKTFGELLITKFDFFKKALKRNQITEDVLKTFVKSSDAATDVVEVLDHGKVVQVSTLDDFFKRLEDNWDELYAEASLRTP